MKRRRGWPAPGSAGTLLSREHSLQASNSRLLRLQPGPLSSPLLPLPDSPGICLAHTPEHRASFVLYFFTSPHPLPFFKPLHLAPIQPQTPLLATLSHCTISSALGAHLFLPFLPL